MRATIYLRIASVVTLVHAVLHTVGGVFGATPAGPASVALAAMKANQFQFMGATRTFWEFHRGLGLAVTIFLTADAIIFWLLGSVVKRDAAAIRPILLVFVLAYMAFAVNSLVYFFALAASMEVIIAILLALAMVSAKPAAKG